MKNKQSQHDNNQSINQSHTSHTILICFSEMLNSFLLYKNTKTS